MRAAGPLVKPRASYAARVDSSLRIGVDLGGTKIEAVVVRLPADSSSGQAPEVLARVRRPTGSELGYAHVVEGAAAVVADVAREAGLTSLPKIGMGMPGSITWRTSEGRPSSAALVKNSNATCLNGRPFRDDLAQRVGSAIVFGNDANCFALAEATIGAARDGIVTFGVIMGTGVGGGVVVRDGLSREGRPRAWDGAQGIAGEWGHVALDAGHGPACYCGKRGCIERYLGGPAIENSYFSRVNERRDLREIAARVESDEHARQTIDELVETFGRAMAVVVNVLDPDVIVLGGGVSNVETLYDRGVSALARSIFNDELRTRVVKNALGDSAGVIGAALLP